jgi:hypothetical protein
MQFLKQSTSASTIVGPILDATGVEYAGAVIGDISYAVNGGSLTVFAASATLTYISNGYYTLLLNTTNTSAIGRLDIVCNKATYQMPPTRFEVLQATVYDALVTNAAGGLNGLVLSKANNIVDSNVISVGPTGANTLQTAGDIGSNILLSTTIATLTSQTQFTLTEASPNNNTYVGQSIIITSASDSRKKAIAIIFSYTGSTKAVRLDNDPAIFTIAAGDLVSIVAQTTGDFRNTWHIGV